MSRINSLYSIEEQISIIWDVRRIKQEYEQDRTPKKRRFYFKNLAESYGLLDRIKTQLAGYPEQNQEDLATKDEIADLFDVHRSSVIRYFNKHLQISPEDLKDYESICRMQGSRRGGENGSTKGYRQKRTWSRKKK